MAVLLAIVAGAALAFWFPEAVLWIGPALGPAFAVTMLMVGTLVRPEQLGAFRATPSRPFVGLGAQYTIMPLLAFYTALCVVTAAAALLWINRRRANPQNLAPANRLEP